MRGGVVAPDEPDAAEGDAVVAECRDRLGAGRQAESRSSIQPAAVARPSPQSGSPTYAASPEAGSTT